MNLLNRGNSYTVTHTDTAASFTDNIFKLSIIYDWISNMFGLGCC